MAKINKKIILEAKCETFRKIIISCICLCTVNGLNHTIFLEWAYLIKMCRDESGYKHFRDLFRLFEDRHYNLYAFHIGNNRYEYIDGTVRRYVHASRR